MKATVIVTLKPAVLDPQGMTIHRCLAPLGLTDITAVRQGKVFDIELKDGSFDLVARAVLQLYIEDLSLPDGGNIRQPQGRQAPMDRHALRIENGRLQRYDDSSFHDRISIFVGAVYDRPFFTESTEYGRS